MLPQNHTPSIAAGIPFAKHAPAQTGAVVVLYHAHCMDGFGAALVAHQVFGGSASYLPVSYGETLPEIPDGSAVYLLDFSYRREVLEELARRCEVRVLDHHATAEKELEGLPFAKFEREKSGAVMAWEWFRDSHPDAIYGPVPKLLEYIQDRDLWRFELTGSKEVSAGLAARERTFKEWSFLMGTGAAGIAHLASEGRIVLRYQAQLVESIVEKRRRIGMDIDDATSVEAVVVNTPVLNSECCHRMLDLEPGAQVAAAWFEREHPTDPNRVRLVWSLRSRPDFACLPIAEKHGGGGHAQACGFEEDRELPVLRDERWTKTPPAESGLWWWWNEDEDSLPIVVDISYSGTSNSYFAGAGQHGWTRFQEVSEMGGFWMRQQEPEHPRR